MRKPLFLILLFCLPILLKAQKYDIGIDIGLANTVKKASAFSSSIPGSTNVNGITNSSIGLTFDRRIGNFSIGLGLFNGVSGLRISPQLGDGQAQNYDYAVYRVSAVNIPLRIGYYLPLNKDFTVQFVLGAGYSRYGVSSVEAGGGGSGAADTATVSSGSTVSIPDFKKSNALGVMASITLMPMTHFKHFSFTMAYNNVIDQTDPISNTSYYTHGSFKESAVYTASIRPVYFSFLLGYHFRFGKINQE